MSLQESYGQHGMNFVDRFGVYLSKLAIRRFISGCSGMTALDIGCGYHATVLRAISPQLDKGVGIDVKIADEVKSISGLSFIEQPAEGTLPSLPDEEFDLILLISVLEHLWNPLFVLRECHRLLKPGGIILGNVPTWRGQVLLEFSAFKLKISPASGMDDHKTYYNKRDLWPIFVQAGFKPSCLTLNYHKFGLNLFARAGKSRICQGGEKADKMDNVDPSKHESYGQSHQSFLMKVRWFFLKRKLLHYLPQKSDLRVLDIGCGYQATLLRALHSRLSEGVGIDFMVSSTSKAISGLSFIEDTSESALPKLPDQSFNVILLLSVLEHLWQPLNILKECYRLLKMDGILIVNVPNWRAKYILETLAFHPFLRAHHSLKSGIDDHKMYYGKRDLWPLLVHAGFRPSCLSLKYHLFGIGLFAVARK